jgi:carboxymethylenebutenolidase
MVSAMCFDPDSSPPVDGDGSDVATSEPVLEATDGNRFAAFRATPDAPRAAVVVLPDVRGLFRFYRELAIRLAEAGYDTVAIDYFGRTAGIGMRDDPEFPFREHVDQTTYEGIRADVAAAVEALRTDDPGRPVFTVGFCFGGSNSWAQASNGHGLAGAIGFYGHPDRERPPGTTVIDRVPAMECPVLGLMGGADPSIPAEVVERFDAALVEHGIEHEIVTYPGAPHSFFDRKYEEFADESSDAWRRVLAFVEAHR